MAEFAQAAAEPAAQYHSHSRAKPTPRAATWPALAWLVLGRGTGAFYPHVP
jgi:hypothetical protein